MGHRGTRQTDVRRAQLERRGGAGDHPAQRFARVRHPLRRPGRPEVKKMTAGMWGSNSGPPASGSAASRSSNWWCQPAIGVFVGVQCGGSLRRPRHLLIGCVAEHHGAARERAGKL